MKVINEIKLLEIKDEKISPAGESRNLIIKSHWNHIDRIHLQFNGHDIVVLASDLLKAIANATNHRSY